MTFADVIGRDLWQWDVGRKIMLRTSGTVNISRVDFSSAAIENLISMPVKEHNGKVIAEIPNVMLQHASDIKLYVVSVESDTERTIFEKTCQVRKKKKPEGYVQEQQEILNYQILEQRVAELEKNAGGIAEETDPTVPDWAKQPEKPTYTAQEVGAMPKDTKIPTKTSELENDSGFLTKHQDLSDYAKKGDVPSTPEDIGAEAKGTVDTKVSEHNTSDSAHNDIRSLIKNLTAKVTTLLDSDDETLDQTSEIVAYIKSNKSLIDAITTSKVSVNDIVDNLTTNLSDKTLSAKQGAVLKGLIDDVQNALNKIVIPTTLPNPHKLTFNGAVSAEYDGSGAVVVTIPNGQSTERIEKNAVDTSVTLEPNKLYIFPEMATLEYTLKKSDDNTVSEYHFIFTSGENATELIHPENVNIGYFTVEANNTYEISIMEGLLSGQNWEIAT